MRTASANFTPDELREGIEYAHAHGVKVHITCNITPHNDEIERIPAFAKMAADADAFANKYVSLTENIDLNNCDLTPIPYFAGTFLGNGHVIMNVNISGEGYVGLFATLRGNIQELGLVNVKVNATTQKSAVENGCTVGDASAGCFAGDARESSLYRCFIVGADVTVNGSDSDGRGVVCAGMFAGFGYSFKIQSGYAEGEVSATAKNAEVYVGGVCGSITNSDFLQSYVSGKVYGSSEAKLNIGGIYGFTWYGKMNMCFSAVSLEAEVSESTMFAYAELIGSNGEGMNPYLCVAAQNVSLKVNGEEATPTYCERMTEEDLKSTAFYATEYTNWTVAGAVRNGDWIIVEGQYPILVTQPGF